MKYEVGQPVWVRTDVTDSLRYYKKGARGTFVGQNQLFGGEFYDIMCWGKILTCTTKDARIGDLFPYFVPRPTLYWRVREWFRSFKK